MSPFSSSKLLEAARSLSGPMVSGRPNPHFLRQHQGKAWLAKVPASCWNRAAMPSVHASSYRLRPLGALHAAVAGASGDQDPGFNPSVHLPGMQKPTAMNWFSKENIEAFQKMARLHNLVPSSLLVLVGAWAGTGHNPSILLSAHVWLMAAVSSGVSAASMVVNDYFDYISGTDQVNAPHKPLPAGRILPDIAVLFGALVYMWVLIMACVMEPAPLRALIAGSAAATFAYTPLLKKWTIVKNVVVAGVIAAALLAGGLAAGVCGSALMPLLPPSIFAFCGVVYREILMDMNDVEGDRAAGVCTLPVVAGPRPALATAVGIAFVGAAAALWLQLTSPAAAGAAASALANAGGLAAGDLGVRWVLAKVAAGAMCVAWAFGRLAYMAWAIHSSGCNKVKLDEAVDSCLGPIGLCIIVLAAVAV